MASIRYDRIVEYGIFAAVTLTTLCMGGRGDIGTFALIVVVWGTGLAACLDIRKRGNQVRLSGLEWVLLAGFAIVDLSDHTVALFASRLFDP